MKADMDARRRVHTTPGKLTEADLVLERERLIALLAAGEARVDDVKRKLNVEKFLATIEAAKEGA